MQRVNELRLIRHASTGHNDGQDTPAVRATTAMDGLAKVGIASADNTRDNRTRTACTVILGFYLVSSKHAAKQTQITNNQFKH